MFKTEKKHEIKSSIREKLLKYLALGTVVASSLMPFTAQASANQKLDLQDQNKAQKPYLNFNFESFIDQHRNIKLEFKSKENKFILPKAFLEVVNRSNFGNPIEVFFDPFLNSVEVTNIVERSNPVSSLVVYFLEHLLQKSSPEIRQKLLKANTSVSPVKIGNINIHINNSNPEYSFENIPKDQKPIILVSEDEFGDIYDANTEKYYKLICNGLEIKDDKGNKIIVTASHCMEDFVKGVQMGTLDGLGPNDKLNLLSQNQDLVILVKMNDLFILGKRNAESIDLAQKYVETLHKSYLKYFHMLVKGAVTDIKFAASTFRGNTENKFFTTPYLTILGNNPNPQLDLKLETSGDTSVYIGKPNPRNEIFASFSEQTSIVPNSTTLLPNGASGSTSYFISTEKDKNGKMKTVLSPIGVISAGNSESTKQFIIDSLGKNVVENKIPYLLSKDDQISYKSIFHIIDGIDVVEFSAVKAQLNKQRLLIKISPKASQNIYKSSYPLYPKSTKTVFENLNPLEYLKSEIIDIMFKYQEDLGTEIDPEMLDFIAFKLDQLLFNKPRLDIGAYFVNLEFKEILKNQNPAKAGSIIEESVFNQLSKYLKSIPNEKYTNTRNFMLKIKPN